MKKTDIGYIVVVLTADNEIGFYTGNSIDTLKSKAKLYKNNLPAQNSVITLNRIKGIKKAEVFFHSMPMRVIKETLTDKKPLRITKKRVVKNPIRGSRTRRVNQAKNLYSSFTGHEAVTEQIVKLPSDDTGLKVGKCLGIMYETVRDGETESYIHEFKRRSQPAFCVSFDGKQIYLIGGKYLFKDSGINDI